MPCAMLCGHARLACLPARWQEKLAPRGPRLAEDFDFLPNFQALGGFLVLRIIQTYPLAERCVLWLKAFSVWPFLPS